MKDFDDIKMHGTTIKIILHILRKSNFSSSGGVLYKQHRVLHHVDYESSS
jgi:hypothetical protein